MHKGTIDLPQLKIFVARSLSLLLLSWKVISCDVPAICVNGVEFIVADVMWIPLVLGKLTFVDRGTVLNCNLLIIHIASLLFKEYKSFQFYDRHCHGRCQ